jgi:TonB family protein
LSGHLTSPTAQAAAKIPQPGPASSTTNEQSSATPSVVALPEIPVSATGSIAIRSRGLLMVPAGVTPPAADGRNLRTGQLTDVIEPYYPPEAQQLHIEGIVKLHASFSADGTSQNVDPVSGPDLLVKSAMSAVRQWKYTPTTLNGKAVATQQDITFVFRLPN